MNTRRSIVILSVPILVVALVMALSLPYFNYNSMHTYTYQLMITRGKNTSLTIKNDVIMLTIAYNNSYGNASSTLISNLFVGEAEKVYVSYVSSFCAAKPTPVPQTSTAYNNPDISLPSPSASHLIIVRPPPPPPPSPILPPPLPPPTPPLQPQPHLPTQNPLGILELYISFIPLTPTMEPVNIPVQLLPCLPFSNVNSPIILQPGFYNVSVKFKWILTGTFTGLNGTLNIDLSHINIITPAPPIHP